MLLGVAVLQDVLGEARMLTLVRPDQQASEARDLLRMVGALPTPEWALLLVLALLGVCLMGGGSYWGGLLTGLAVSLALSRYGPSWWPGRR